MNRRGVALLTVLWFVVLASGVAMSLLTRGRRDLATTINRISQGRGRWAAEGCLAILVEGYRSGEPPAPGERVGLGGLRWCRVEVEDPGTALALDRADARQLALLFGSDSVAAAILDWIDGDDRPRPLGAERAVYRHLGRRAPRNAPLAAVEELADVVGVEPEVLDRVAPFLTVRGSGRVNLNSAPAEVLALLPGMSPEYAREIVERRRAGAPLGSLDELVSRAPPSTRVALGDAYSRLLGWVSIGPEALVVRAQGAEGNGAKAEIIATFIPSGERLVLIRKEVW